MDRGGFIRGPERAGLDRFPEQVDEEDLVDCFTLTDADLDFVMGRRGRSIRLATGLQVGALRLMGFIPEDLSSAPEPVVAFVAGQVHAEVGDLVALDRVRGTLWRNRAGVERHLGFRRASAGDIKRLDDWLGDRAVEHDQPWVLFRSGCAWLKSEQVVRVGPTVMERAVMAARQRATERTYMVLASQLDRITRGALDRLLAADDGETDCVLAGLRRSPTGRVGAQIIALVERLELLRSVGGDRFDVSGLPANRVRFLAGLGRRMSPSAIARLALERRYQILVCSVVDATVRTIDQIIDLFDVAVTAVNRPPETRPGSPERHHRSTIRIADAFAAICALVFDPEVADGDLRSAILATVDESQLKELSGEAVEVTNTAGEFESLLAGRYRTARRFAPRVLAAIGL